ncbi:Methionine aminotransferase (fragment) [Shewanella benthica]|uniref:Methionine aminotransferase n=1 Tax=Shewanella benthica TaxID=43661 RepID=A0A330M2Y4_9GAMM
MSTLDLSSKLPNLGTSIFTYMTGLANQYHAINLSQGFPEFDAPKRLKQGLAKYCDQGFNQYAPSSGLAPLQTQIASLIGRQYGIDVNPNDTITVTSGATEALFVTIQTITHPGDEIIIFDPAYDSYKPAIELAGGRAVHIAMQAPDYAINWQQVAAAITDKTRGIIQRSQH